MKKNFMTGFLAVFSIGIIGFIGKMVVYDFLAPFFRPLVLLLFGRDDAYLVIILTIVFTIVIMFLVGLVLSRVFFQRIINWILKKVIKDIEKGNGALVEKAPGVHDLAIFIKEIKFKRLTGLIENRCILFAPYAPIPASGMPIIFAKKEKVIRLTMSYRELYNTISSFGKNAPEIIEELKDESTK